MKSGVDTEHEPVVALGGKVVHSRLFVEVGTARVCVKLSRDRERFRDGKERSCTRAGRVCSRLAALVHGERRQMDKHSFAICEAKNLV